MTETVVFCGKFTTIVDSHFVPFPFRSRIISCLIVSIAVTRYLYFSSRSLGCVKLLIAVRFRYTVLLNGLQQCSGR